MSAPGIKLPGSARVPGEDHNDGRHVMLGRDEYQRRGFGPGEDHNHHTGQLWGQNGT